MAYPITAISLVPSEGASSDVACPLLIINTPPSILKESSLRQVPFLAGGVWRCEKLAQFVHKIAQIEHSVAYTGSFIANEIAAGDGTFRSVINSSSTLKGHSLTKVPFQKGGNGGGSYGVNSSN